MAMPKSPTLRTRLWRLRRPTQKWLVGVLVAALASYLTATISGVFPSITKPLQSYFSSAACSYEQTKKSDDSQFLVLVSPLGGDTNGSQTTRILNAFHGEGFNALRICQSIGF